MNNWRKDWERKFLAEFSELVHGDDHGKYCACWQCIGRLQAWIVRTQKERLEREGTSD